jgi:hypothetical protein
MLGLFQELGPCRINNQSSGVDLNTMSWNNDANVYASICLDSICRYYSRLNGGGSGYSSTSPSGLASLTGRRPSVPRRKLPPTYGSSYKSGLRTGDSKSTLIGNLRSGRSRTVGTTALNLLRESTSLDSSPYHSLWSSTGTF